MFTRPVFDEALSQRMLPQSNADRQDRARAWAEWQASVGEPVLKQFVRVHNNTHETDEDIIQDTLLTAYLGVERGAYQPRDGVPFAAYVVGIARNKVREAWRRERYRADLEDASGGSWPGKYVSTPSRSIPSSGASSVICCAVVFPAFRGYGVRCWSTISLEQVPVRSPTAWR